MRPIRRNLRIATAAFVSFVVIVLSAPAALAARLDPDSSAIRTSSSSRGWLIAIVAVAAGLALAAVAVTMTIGRSHQKARVAQRFPHHA